jgi:hypothetical protein
MLLSGFLVPLGLALIAPVIVNIFAFHAVLAPAGMGMAYFISILEIYLAYSYRDSFLPMLALRAKPKI